jgi:hypothetical protein
MSFRLPQASAGLLCGESGDVRIVAHAIDGLAINSVYVTHPLQATTTIPADGYTQLARPIGRSVVISDTFTADNSWVVPHNRYHAQAARSLCTPFANNIEQVLTGKVRSSH